MNSYGPHPVLRTTFSRKAEEGKQIKALFTLFPSSVSRQRVRAAGVRV